MDILIVVIIIAATVGIGIFVSRTKQKPPSEPAEDRDVEWRISTAKSRAIEAEARLAELRVLASKVEAQVRDAIKKGRTGRIWKSFRESPKLWGSGVYVWLSLLGMLYALSYYQSFEIDIFNFVELSDFLLMAFSKAGIVLYILLGILLVLVISIIVLFLLSFIGYLFFIRKSVKSYIVLAYESIKGGILLADKTFTVSFHAAWDEFIERLRTAWGTFADSLDTTKDSRRVAREKCVSFFWRFLYRVVLVTLIFGTVYVPRHQGEQEAQDLLNGRQNKKAASDSLILQIDSKLLSVYPGLRNYPLTVGIFGKQDSQQRQLVRVTIRQDAVQPKTFLPKTGHTLLIGTTSSFHFFYECENDLTAVVWEHEWSALKSLAFGWWNTLEEARSECKKGWPFIIPTANIASLEFNPRKNEKTDQVGLPDVVKAVTDLNKTISNLKFNALFKMESGDVIFDTTKVAKEITQIDTTLAAIKKSSKANMEEITRAIKGLKPGDVSNPGHGSGEIAAAINALNETVQNLHISVGKNHCASGWKKVETIGPFPIGDHDQLEKTAQECQNQLLTPDQFVNKMDGYFTTQQPILIGRVDITQLSDQARKDYGSDSGLAQARAKWVRDELIKNFKDKEQKDALKRAILLSAGPLHVRGNASDCNRALDRSVEAWACWTPKEPDASDLGPPEVRR